MQNKKHKVDTLFSSQIRVNVAEWKEALSCPEKWMRHQRANFNLHDSLNRIELVVKSEVEGMSFDKSHVEAEILSIANPKKAEAIMKAKREEEERQREEERIKEEQERLIKEGIDAERAKIWNFIDRFCNEIKSGARLNGHDRYAPGTVKAWNSFRKLYVNPNLKAICEKYNYNLPYVVDVILNRYIKEILKELSDKVPDLAKMVVTKLTQKQKKLVEDGKLVVEHNEKGEVIMPRYKCVTTHTARRSGITNMYLTHKYSIVQMMHVSGHKTQKTFMDYIKLSSDEIADEIDAIANGAKSEVF